VCLVARVVLNLVKTLEKDDCRGSTKVRREESGRYPEEEKQALELYCAHSASNTVANRVVRGGGKKS